MPLTEIFGGSAGILVVLLTLIEITPVKVNPWSWFAKKIGRAMNGQVIEKVEKLEDKIEGLEKKIDAEHESMAEYKARQSRCRILRFGDEVRNGQLHTKEHFDDILVDIDLYEQYCERHKDFRNGVSVQTIQYIKRVYAKRLEKNDFL